MLAFGLVANSIISVVFSQYEELLGHEIADSITNSLIGYPFFSSKSLYIFNTLFYVVFRNLTFL